LVRESGRPGCFGAYTRDRPLYRDGDGRRSITTPICEFNVATSVCPTASRAMPLIQEREKVAATLTGRSRRRRRLARFPGFSFDARRAGDPADLQLDYFPKATK